MRILSVAIACLLVIGVSHADDVRASMKVPTNIPAQDLEQALKSFAQDRRLYLIYASQDIDTLHTNGAVGEFTADQTLTKLLDGTGLDVSPPRRQDDHHSPGRPRKLRCPPRRPVRRRREAGRTTILPEKETRKNPSGTAFAWLRWIRAELWRQPP